MPGVASGIEGPQGAPVLPECGVIRVSVARPASPEGERK